MDHEIHGTLHLSAEIPGGREALEAVVPRLAEEALARGLGKRGSGTLREWHVSGDRLELRMESRGGRPHQALLAFARKLAEELGRSQKVGVRSITVPTYRLRFSIDQAPKRPVTLPIPHRLAIEGSEATLELLDLPEEALRDNWPDRAVALVQEKIRLQHYEGKGEYWKLLATGPKRDAKFHDDPTEAMIARHWIRNGPTKGKWFLGPTAAYLLRTMERIAVTEVLLPLGFQEVVQPHHDSFDTLLKTGHLGGLPGEFYYVSEPKSRDPAAWEAFTDFVKIAKKVPAERLAELVTPPVAVSCYAQCPTVYWWLTGRTLANESLPVKVFDRAAVTNRYESGGRHGLERVDEFHRIEPVYLGTPDQIVALRDELLGRYTRVFNEILELEWRTARVTPFYLQQSGAATPADPLDAVQGTIDFEAYLPYRGPREEAEWLEFQNLSIVGEKYTRPFTIKAQSGELWSGCSGIGLERWLTSFLAQKGLDRDAWPAPFQKYVGELPADVRFV